MILEIGEITATVIVSDETAVSCKLKTQTSRRITTTEVKRLPQAGP